MAENIEMVFKEHPSNGMTADFYIDIIIANVDAICPRTHELYMLIVLVETAFQQILIREKIKTEDTDLDEKKPELPEVPMNISYLPKRAYYMRAAKRRFTKFYSPKAPTPLKQRRLKKESNEKAVNDAKKEKQIAADVKFCHQFVCDFLGLRKRKY